MLGTFFPDKKWEGKEKEEEAAAIRTHQRASHQANAQASAAQTCFLEFRVQPAASQPPVPSLFPYIPTFHIKTLAMRSRRSLR